MSESQIILFLIFYIFVREVFFLYSTQKFVNKIMSRSYYEYQQSKQIEPVQPPVRKFDNDEPEDLGTLEGFGVL